MLRGRPCAWVRCCWKWIPARRASTPGGDVAGAGSGSACAVAAAAGAGDRRVPGTVLGRLGGLSGASAAGVGRGGCRPAEGARGAAALAAELDEECERLVATGVLPAGLVARSREMAGAALRPRAPDRLGDLLAGYGGGAGLDVVRVWSSLRCLVVIRPLLAQGLLPSRRAVRSTWSRM